MDGLLRHFMHVHLYVAFENIRLNTMILTNYKMPEEMEMPVYPLCRLITAHKMSMIETSDAGIAFCTKYLLAHSITFAQIF